VKGKRRKETTMRVGDIVTDKNGMTGRIDVIDPSWGKPEKVRIQYVEFGYNDPEKLPTSEWEKWFLVDDITVHK
jgi:hypothetical protein